MEQQSMPWGGGACLGLGNYDNHVTLAPRCWRLVTLREIQAHGRHESDVINVIYVYTHSHRSNK